MISIEAAGLPILVAGGITLSAPDERDAEALFRLIDSNRERLAEWMPWLNQMRNADDCLAYIRYSIEGNRDRRFLNLLVWVDGRPVGVVCFFAIESYMRRAEIGYWLGDEWLGQGIMRRSVAALIHYGFTQLGLYRIQIACAVDNRPSRALPESIGFQLEGVLRGREWIGERVVDHAIYGLLLPDWQTQQHR